MGNDNMNKSFTNNNDKSSMKKNSNDKSNIDDLESIADVHMDEEFDAFDLEEFKKKYLNRDKHLQKRDREELEFEDEFDIAPDEMAQERLKQ